MANYADGRGLALRGRLLIDDVLPVWTWTVEAAAAVSACAR